MYLPVHINVHFMKKIQKIVRLENRVNKGHVHVVCVTMTTVLFAASAAAQSCCVWPLALQTL